MKRIIRMLEGIIILLFSFFSSSGMMGAEAGIVKAQQIYFDRMWKTTATVTATQSIEPLGGQVGFQSSSMDANVPQQIEGPGSNLLKSTGSESGEASFFENPNGGTEPTLSRGLEGQTPKVRVLQTGGNTLNNSTLKALNLTKGEGKAAIEGLKNDLGLPSNFHGKILSNGDLLDSHSGQVMGNLFDYLP